MPIITDHQPKWLEHVGTEEQHRCLKSQLTIGSNIYHWRSYRGLSQTKLATQASITQSIVSELEGGDYNSSIDMLTRIAHALSIKVEYLLKEDFNWKFVEMLDYLVSKTKEVDIPKLMKLAYLADFLHKQKTGHKLTGMNYVRRHAGPFTTKIYLADKFFKKHGEIFSNQTNLIKKVSLTTTDEKFLDKIVKDYGALSTADLIDQSYQTPPLKGCTIKNHHKMGEHIF